MTSFRAAVAVGLLLPCAAFSQVAPLPPRGATPLLYVRVSGPPGMKATFYQGRAAPRVLPAPATVGLRAGYAYRIGLADFPDRPGLTLFPTLEVRGSLCLPPRINPAAFPATVAITPADVEAALGGTLVTKVIYLEHPDRAEPRPTQPGQILETDLGPSEDLQREAIRRGRVMLVLRLGERVPTAEELTFGTVPGTILFPGQKVLPMPAAPPCLPGGGRAGDEECLRDGGDRFTPAGFDAEGNLTGLDPEDTVAEYTDAQGRRSISCSTRVCLTVPRFAALRKELPLSRAEGVIGPEGRTCVKRDREVNAGQPSLTARKLATTLGYQGKMRASQNVAGVGTGTFFKMEALHARQLDLGPAEALCTKRVLTLSPAVKAELARCLALTHSLSLVAGVAGIENSVGTSVVGRAENGPELFTGYAATRDVTFCCNEAPVPPDKPLVVVKCADRGAAQVGEEVTFSIRYSNVGGRAMTDVAVSDSLSPRLEYVPGSAEADREAVFTVQDNGAGSLVLRWEISGRLLPGTSGRVRFRARVR